MKQAKHGHVFHAGRLGVGAVFALTALASTSEGAQQQMLKKQYVSPETRLTAYQAEEHIKQDPQVLKEFEHAMESRNTVAASKILLASGFSEVGQYHIELPGPDRLSRGGPIAQPLWHCGFYARKLGDGEYQLGFTCNWG